jgi:hypothetical protein
MEIKRYRGIAGLILATLFIVSCEPDGTSGLPEDFDRSNEVIEVTVIWHKSQQAVDSAYVEEFGRARNESAINRLGFAVWADPSRDPKWCRIHAVKPTRVKNDEKMDTLGHELLHCVIGTFHTEPK